MCPLRFVSFRCSLPYRIGIGDNTRDVALFVAVQNRRETALLGVAVFDVFVASARSPLRFEKRRTRRRSGFQLDDDGRPVPSTGEANPRFGEGDAIPFDRTVSR